MAGAVRQAAGARLGMHLVGTRRHLAALADEPAQAPGHVIGRRCDVRD